MKTEIKLIGLLSIIISSCSYPRYMPSADQLDVNQYGSYIKIIQRKAPNSKGELIAIDTSKIIVLTEKTKQCRIIPINEIVSFSLHYAKPKPYRWTIPAYGIASLFHGVFLVFSTPINLTVTILASSNPFKYSDKHMSFEKLKMFARFPQGIPPNVDIASIK